MKTGILFFAAAFALAGCGGGSGAGVAPGAVLERGEGSLSAVSGAAENAPRTRMSSDGASTTQSARGADDIRAETSYSDSVAGLRGLVPRQNGESANVIIRNRNGAGRFGRSISVQSGSFADGEFELSRDLTESGGTLQVRGFTDIEGADDTDYLTGGTWLFIPDDAGNFPAYEVGAFVDGASPTPAAYFREASGRATFSGRASGVRLIGDAGGGGLDITRGYRESDIDLTADFDGDAASGNSPFIFGDLSNFDAVSECVGASNRCSGASDFSVSLERAIIRANGSFNGAVDYTEEGIEYSGVWGGQFYGNEASSVAGTFGYRSANDPNGEFYYLGVFRARDK